MPKAKAYINPDFMVSPCSFCYDGNSKKVQVSPLHGSEWLIAARYSPDGRSIVAPTKDSLVLMIFDRCMVNLNDVQRPFNFIGRHSGLVPDVSSLVIRDTGSPEVYRLRLNLP